jgi:hypothetical protein
LQAGPLRVARPKSSETMNTGESGPRTPLTSRNNNSVVLSVGKLLLEKKLDISKSINDTASDFGGLFTPTKS